MCDYLNSSPILNGRKSNNRNLGKTWSLVPNKNLMAPSTTQCSKKLPSRSRSASFTSTYSHFKPTCQEYTGCFATRSVEKSIEQLIKLNKDYHSWSVKLNRRKEPNSELQGSQNELVSTLLNLNQEFTINQNDMDLGVPLARTAGKTINSFTFLTTTEQNLLKLNRVYQDQHPVPSAAVKDDGVLLQGRNGEPNSNVDLAQLKALNESFHNHWKQVDESANLKHSGVVSLRGSGGDSVKNLIKLNQEYQQETQKLSISNEGVLLARHK